MRDEEFFDGMFDLMDQLRASVAVMLAILIEHGVINEEDYIAVREATLDRYREERQR